MRRALPSNNGRDAVVLCVLTAFLPVTACSALEGTSERQPVPTSSTFAWVSPSASLSRDETYPANLAPEETQAAQVSLEAYQMYIAVTDQVFQGGGEPAELLETAAASEALISARNEAAYLEQNELHTSGETVLRNVRVRSVGMDRDPSKFIVPEVIVDSCEDVTKTRLLDKNGKSVRESSAPTAWETTVWIRYYPEASAGVDGWVVAERTNEGVESCYP